jgi:hypothetical protein
VAAASPLQIGVPNGLPTKTMGAKWRGAAIRYT